ncbi:hypothetical protein ACFJIV_27550 [Mucilaginibacter sp. UC70_90]
MKLLNKGAYLRAGLITLITLIVLNIAGANPAHAVQKKAADTSVSAADVTFTNIPTAADSIAIRKKQADSVKKAEAAKATKTPPAASKTAEKPKSLWQIFIEGLLAVSPR